MNLWLLSKGPLITIAVALMIELVSRTLFDIPSIAPLFLTIVYAAFLGGLPSGLISALVTIAYAISTLAIPGTFLAYTQGNLIYLLTIAGTAPMLAVLVGVLKQRSERDQIETSRIQRYQSLLLQSVSDSIIATDSQLRIQAWNRASELIYGWSHAEVYGKPITEVIRPLRYLGDGQESDALALLTRQSFWNGQVIQCHRDGHELFVEASVRLIYDSDGTLVGAVAVNRDLTEHQRAQAERDRLMRQLADQERSLRFLAQASKVLADSLDYEWTIKTVAGLALPELADWCMVHLVDLDGRLHCPAVAHVNPELEVQIRELQCRYPLDLGDDVPISRTLRTGETQLVGELDQECVSPFSHDECHLQMLRVLGFKAYMVVPITAHGRTLGAATFVSGSRSYTSDDLEQACDLMRRCGLAMDNARLYREAQEALQTRDQLMLTVSHDLKNPLSAIKGYANFLQRRVQRMGIAEIAWLDDSLAKIDTTTKKMTALINEMLDFARLQAGQSLDLDQRSTDLVALVSQTAAEYQQATENHQICVSSSAPELVGLYDTARLERVLANLLSNAIKYSPDGGEILVTISQVQAVDGRWAVIKVRDPGLGIPSGDLPHIFEPFRRAENVVGRIRGTGIGLTSAKQIVEQHGGMLTVASDEGAGSTFTICLPLTSLPDSEALA